MDDADEFLTFLRHQNAVARWIQLSENSGPQVGDQLVIYFVETCLRQNAEIGGFPAG